MVKEISNSTIMVLTIVAVVISVLSITLSLMAINKVAIVSEQAQVESMPSGVIFVEVPPQPTESGAQVFLNVIEKTKEVL